MFKALFKLLFKRKKRIKYFLINQPKHNEDYYGC